MARLEPSDAPCLIMTDDELKAANTLGEWRNDRHDLAAARIFGGPRVDDNFPQAFQRYREAPRTLISAFSKRTTPFSQAPSEERGTLLKTVRNIFIKTPSVSEHHTSASTIDAKNVVSLRPNIN
jgi:hypothetical protein